MKIKKTDISKYQHFDLHHLEDACVSSCVEDLPICLPEGAIMHLSILSEMLNEGAWAGLCVGNAILAMPESYKGKLLLSYDVSMEDPREVWEVPEVVEFTRGMMLSQFQVLSWFEGDTHLSPYSRKRFSFLDTSQGIALICTFPDILQRMGGKVFASKADIISLVSLWETMTAKGDVLHRDMNLPTRWIDLIKQYSYTALVQKHLRRETTWKIALCTHSWGVDDSSREA